MERNSHFMDCESQYYIDVIPPRLVYVTPIKRLPIFWVKVYKLSIKLTWK